MVKTLVLGELSAEMVIDALYDYQEKMMAKDDGSDLYYYNVACRISDILKELGE
jgi:hypothetical protein